MAKSNNGAPGIDGVTFETIEESRVESFLKQIQDELPPTQVPKTRRAQLHSSLV